MRTYSLYVIATVGVFLCCQAGFAQSSTQSPILRMEKLLQVIHFDSAAIAKKLKVGEDKAAAKILDFSIDAYETEISDLERGHQEFIQRNFVAYDQAIDKIDDAMDFEAALAQVDLLKISLDPVTQDIRDVERRLDARLQLLFSEKQYKTWQRLVSRKKKKQTNRVAMPMAGPSTTDDLF